jgi:CHAD domain-containing protein
MDVVLALLEELRKDGKHRAALAATAGHLREERDRILAESRKHPLTPELRRIARTFDDVHEGLQKEKASDPRKQQWKWAIDARVMRCALTLKQTIHERGSIYSPESLHTVRIAMKKLRYSLELAREASGASGDRDLATLKREQTLLGRIHDFEQLTDRIRRFQSALVQPTLSLWRDLDQLVVWLESSCHRMHARYVRDREELLAICQRLTVKSVSSRHVVARRRAG